jgi:7-cyano-7-deazaguanine synthase
MPASESLGRTNAVVLFSGGLDSTACVRLLQTNGFEVTGLFVDFGQPAAEAESRAVATLKKHLAIKVDSLRISGFCDLKAGELFGRNLLLISAALFYSTGQKCVIGTGIHAGTSYYDCSQQFLASVNALTSAQSDGRVSVFAPFATWSKRDILDYANAQSLPIADTYSCEQGSLPCCGLCASCRDRKELQC